MRIVVLLCGLLLCPGLCVAEPGVPGADAAPAATAESAVTAEPAVTAAPGADAAPVVPAEPAAADVPAATAPPAATAEPAAADEPAVTAAPAAADAAPEAADADKKQPDLKEQARPGKAQSPSQLYLPASGELSSPFGLRRIPRGRGSKVHKGVDIKADSGTPVCAAAPGTVCFAGLKRGYGIVVEIEHGKGLLTRYAHLESAAVEVGKEVATGDLIGEVGRTGHTTGPNLHFETVVNGRYMDPMPFLGLKWQPQNFSRPSFVSRLMPGQYSRLAPGTSLALPGAASGTPSKALEARKKRLEQKRQAKKRAAPDADKADTSEASSAGTAD